MESAAQQGSVDPFSAAPGKKTSEFMATLANLVLSFVIALGALIHPGFEIDATTQGFIISFATSGGALGSIAYSIYRSKVKAKVAEAAAVNPNVLTASGTDQVPPVS